MLIGKRLNGRYKVIKMIGGGGMANVYLARDIILERDVAIKVLRLEFASEDEFLRRFHREAQSATSLVHPNIVNIYDVGEEEGMNFLVMEYVDGMTLKEFIQKSPIPVEKAIDVMKQLASAIAFAHHNSIIHRDIKPHNILIDHDGNVKITDFGIAMALSATSITQTNAVLGSVHYISPEQARGGMATKKSDIYALGIVMFELLTGKLPFSGESAVSIAIKHLQTETPSLKEFQPGIPQSVENIVMKATAKDPLHRYETVEAMEEDLATALDPERLNDPKFMIPDLDDEATKAIPIIKDPAIAEAEEETKVRPNPAMKQATAEIKEKKPEKKKRKWPLIVFIFLLLAALAGLAAAFIPGLIGPKDMEVPNVNGKKLDAAVSEIVTKGLTVGETTERFSDEVPEGMVIETKPEAGSSVKEGDSIDLLVSAGKETVEFGDYQDENYEEIAEELEKEGYKEVSQELVYDESEPGTIIDQDPEAGNKIIPGETEVVFTVSQGLEKVSLIDLTDYNQKSLQDYAQSTGLNIEVIKEEYSDTVGEGLVISQSPEQGSKLHVGEKVEVVVSKGKREIPPKTVTKEIIIPYEPEIDGTPQEVQIYVEDMNRSMTEPYEVFMIQGETKKTLEFIMQRGMKAGYKVIRDQRVIMDETIPYPEEEENNEGGA
ncbi:serine/threonine-protein kinase [Bacillus ectoiniformans]|uniref:Stk1 family PASTA domain-containing Ser/Thr kinase n=1 Tax=Bacillus ectoiniformans TaxID=1494429 RepID=UPI001958E11A|nr:Stk1 family PASTA domain-containing Ser/Thr kinase [Bacillus ectoiniformans]MBM7647177.1 serine/threonine-protein kinase [Bacillus ectoiniformans]